MPPMKALTLGEFRDLGLVQEINRLVLHPAGLALSVAYNDSPGARERDEFEIRILDARDDPEGFAFDFGPAPAVDPAGAVAKAAEYQRLVEALRPAREALFGASVQPLPEIRRCDCGAPVDEGNPDCAEFGLCAEHSDYA